MNEHQNDGGEPQYDLNGQGPTGQGQQSPYGQQGHDQASQGQPQYGQQQYANQDQFGQQAYGQGEHPGQGQYGQAPYGQSQYGQSQYGQSQYVQPGYDQGQYATPAYGGYGYGYGAQPMSTQPGSHVGPIAALKMFFKKYAQFHGRSSRSEYWWVALWGFVLSLVAAGLIGVIMVTGTDSSGELTDSGSLMFLVLMLLFGLVYLATLIPNIALTVRRLHDANFSGFFWFLALVPYLGGLALLVLNVLPSKPEGARFDDQSRPPQEAAPTGTDVRI